MRERIDHLARLGTANIEISGGEPLLHPDLDELIRHIRGTGALAGLITNGYLLSEKRIEDFNNAGLDRLQISIDNVNPDNVSNKSLRVLDAKLQLLAKHAAFSVNINSVLGGDLGNPEDALTIAQRAIELGLTATVGLIHNGHGHLMPLTPEQQRVYSEITSLTAPFYTVRTRTISSRTSRSGARTTGSAEPVAAISTSARTASCIGAHSSADIRGSRSPSTPPRMCGARARARRAVRRSAPCRACTAWRCSTAFARSLSRRSTR